MKLPNTPVMSWQKMAVADKRGHPFEVEGEYQISERPNVRLSRFGFLAFSLPRLAQRVLPDQLNMQFSHPVPSASACHRSAGSNCMAGASTFMCYQAGRRISICVLIGWQAHQHLSANSLEGESAFM